MEPRTLVVLLLVLVSEALRPSFEGNEDFIEFVAKYNKHYPTTEEFLTRSRIFHENKQKIEKWNKQSSTSGFGVNQFTDLTEAEFARQRLLSKQAGIDIPCDVKEVHDQEMLTLPSSFNWVDKGAVTSVKDQGSVGTCWAFSTAGNIEGQWFLTHHELQSLSVEQMNDCDPLDCGVFGGWPCRAYQYVVDVGGLMTDAQYPYCVGTGACYPCPAPGWNNTFCGPPVTYCNASQWPCRAHTNTKFAASISGWKSFGDNETLLMASLLETGPLSVLINAAGIPPLQFHEYGVYDPEWCDPTALDHAVLLVGWGTEQSEFFADVPYWIIKNSWGTDWGDAGYFKMRRGSGTCGVNTAVTSSIV